ncbi:hypothetical protein GQ602_002168 [Ophiocordyceps camponoti-floridani]|uniref:Uncharacterized protein n=1 Tax=Ophiocordyceps camponoti-floridani TaxID=2030778 RepID=A0A8H4VFD4_9HYPO|nr:hypothetical protein GQ602_002168 [Ophiocordyceps camponoti-floridani]
MMRFLQIIPFLALPLLVRGDDWQIRECISPQDANIGPLLSQFLVHASNCVSQNEGFGVVRCAELLLSADERHTLTNLTETIKSWERYYYRDLSTAFSNFGDIDGSHINCYDRLLDILEMTGQLCYYKNIPSFADRLRPQGAGLLTLFYQTERLRPELLRSGNRVTQYSLRSPILKMTGSMDWISDVTQACAADSKEERQFQKLAIEDMIRRVGQDWHSEYSTMQFKGYYETLFSTDSFLQAVITGWGFEYYCSARMKCQGIVEEGKTYLPHHTASYLQGLHKLLKGKGKVCILLKPEATNLEADVTYVAAIHDRIRHV